METIGTGTDYEFDIVDNSAVGQGTATVTTRAYLATLGYTSTVNKTTVIGTETVKNDYIKTDISAITSKNTPNVVIKASDKAYHVFAPTATSGAVTKVTKEANGSYTMTLSDGTVLKESKLTHGDKQAAINDVIAILSGRDHVTPTYYFLLDTHGHYMFLSEKYFRTVAYFTGVLKPVSDWNSWSNEVAYVAQFVDVADPTQVEEIPVTLAWANAALNRIDTSTGRSVMWYYDITDELYGDARYSPEPVFVNDYLYGTKYMYSDGVGFDIYDETRHAVDVWFGDELQGSYRYDPDTIVFNIAYGAGSSLEIETYVGVDALVKGYAEKHGVTIQSLDLMHVAMTYQFTSVGNKEILSVFGFEEVNANGAYLFVPNTITWGYYTLANAAYINGSAELGTLKFEKDYFEDELKKTVERGFYWYSVETRNGVSYTKLDRVKAQDMGYEYVGKTGGIEIAGTKAWINGNPVASDCTFVDVRTGAGVAFDSVTDFITFCKEHANEQLLIAYMWIGNEKEISVIYVVDDIYGVADVKMDDALVGWTVTPMVYEGGTIKLYNKDALAKIAGNTKINLTYQWREYWFDQNGNKVYVSDGAWTNGYKSAVGTVSAGTTPYISVAINDLVPVGTQHKQVEVEILGVSYDVKVVNNATKFDLWYKNPSNGKAIEVVDKDVVEITVNVGDQIALGFHRDGVAEGTVATVTMNGTDTMKVTWLAGGNVWTDAFVPETNTVIVNSILANYRYELYGDRMIECWGFDVSGVNKTAVFANIVPGDGVAMSIKQLQGKDAILGAASAEDSAKLLFGGAEFLSINAVSEAENCVFNFVKVVPGAVTVAADGVTNVVAVTANGWGPDDGNIT